jgi:hypothetical protein
MSVSNYEVSLLTALKNVSERLEISSQGFYIAENTEAPTLTDTSF